MFSSKLLCACTEKWQQMKWSVRKITSLPACTVIEHQKFSTTAIIMVFQETAVAPSDISSGAFVLHKLFHENSISWELIEPWLITCPSEISKRIVGFLAFFILIISKYRNHFILVSRIGRDGWRSSSGTLFSHHNSHLYDQFQLYIPVYKPALCLSMSFSWNVSIAIYVGKPDRRFCNLTSTQQLSK